VWVLKIIIVECDVGTKIIIMECGMGTKIIIVERGVGTKNYDRGMWCGY